MKLRFTATLALLVAFAGCKPTGAPVVPSTPAPSSPIQTGAPAWFFAQSHRYTLDTKQVAAAKSLGFRHLRVGFESQYVAYTGDAAGQHPSWNLAPYTAEVNAYRAAGIRLVVLASSWAQTERGLAPEPLMTEQLHGAFELAIETAFGDDIDEIEYGNECDLSQNAAGEPGAGWKNAQGQIMPDEWFAWASISAGIVRKAFPKVHLGTCSTSNPYVAWAQRLVALKAFASQGGPFDILNLHAYGTDENTDSNGVVHLANFTSRVAPACAVATAVGGTCVMTEWGDGTGEGLAPLAAECLADDIACGWYELQDDDLPCGNAAGGAWGIIDCSYQPKQPAGAAVQKANAANPF